MTSDLTRRLRANARRLGILALILAIVYFVLGQPLLDTIIVGVILTLGYLANSSKNRSIINESTQIFGIDKRIFSVIGAVVAFVSFLALFILHRTGLSVVGVAFSMWAIFDSIQHLRYDDNPLKKQTIDSKDELRKEFLYTNIAGYVARSLRNCPKTESELAASLDLTDSQLKEALERLQSADIIYFDGEKYHAQEEKFGHLVFIRKICRDVVRRFMKPFRMS